MVSKGRKIPIFDEHGLLTKQAVLAYMNNELPPEVHEQVGKHIAADEMYSDVLEGLKQISGKGLAQAEIASLNEKIAAKSGAEISGGATFHLFDFLYEHRKIAAAIIGFLIFFATITTGMLWQMERADIAQHQQNNDVQQDNTKEKSADERLPEEAEKNVPAFADSSESVTPDMEIVMDELAETTRQQEFSQVAGNKEQINTLKPEQQRADDVGVNNKSAPPIAAERKAEIAEEVSQSKTADGGADLGTAKAAAKMPMDATDKDYVDGEIFSLAEEMPEFPGGETALRQYIRDSMKVGKRSRSKQSPAKVYVSFVVDVSGKVKDVSVVKGAGKVADAEAVRIVSSMPAWKPGLQNGNPVAVKYYLTIDFSKE